MLVVVVVVFRHEKLILVGTLCLVRRQPRMIQNHLFFHIQTTKLSLICATCTWEQKNWKVRPLIWSSLWYRSSFRLLWANPAQSHNSQRTCVSEHFILTYRTEYVLQKISLIDRTLIDSYVNNLLLYKIEWTAKCDLL